MLGALTAAGIAVTVPDSFGPQAYDVPADAWVAAHEVLRDEVGLTFFDFLTASDELNDGFRVVTHLADFWGGSHVEHVMVRTLIPRATPQLASLADVYAGANWHERETAEMFGITFDGHPNLVPLLLPDGFEGNPLRKEFVLASRVAKPWPGAKEPGESDHAPAAKAGAPESPPHPPTRRPRPRILGPPPTRLTHPRPASPRPGRSHPSPPPPPRRRTPPTTTPPADTSTPPPADLPERGSETPES